MNAFRASAILALLLALPAFAQAYAAQRAELVDEIRHYVNLVDDKPIRADVLESLNTVERHRLVPSRAIPNAYENRPLSIGWGQTISQPKKVYSRRHARATN